MQHESKTRSVGFGVGCVGFDVGSVGHDAGITFSTKDIMTEMHHETARVTSMR
jgi:hypothetical protein